MSENVKPKIKAPSFEEVISALEDDKIMLGGILIINVISDYKKINDKITMPVVSTYKIEIIQSTKQCILDLLRNIHETTPIVALQYMRAVNLQLPPETEEMIKTLQKSCGPECEEKNCTNPECKDSECKGCKSED